MLDAQSIIQKLGLTPLAGEGGYYRETYRTDEALPAARLPARYKSERSLGTAIYYMLTPETCSRMHRLLTDEVYHFYLGNPVTMLLLYESGKSETITLGQDIESGQRVQVMVPRGTWQGSYVIDGGKYALMGTTMAPGYDPSDYEAGERGELIRQYPDRRDLIIRLTP